MKKLYIILSFLSVALMANAQETTPDLSEKKQQDIEALKVALISKELELTPDEAQKFWPVYNQYSKDMNDAVKDNPPVIERDEKVLAVRKKYRDNFVKILGTQQRMDRMFGVDVKIRHILIKALQRQQMKRALRNNRPLRNQ